MGSISAHTGRLAWLKPILHLPSRELTIAILGNSLRLVLFERGRITRWGHIPINPALLGGDGSIADRQGISQVVKNALANKGIPKTPAIVALPGFQSLCRVISIPNVKGIVPGNVIPREARHLMSYSEKEYYLFWHEAAPKTGKFVVVMVPRNPLQDLVETMELAGISIRRVELAPLALARAAIQPQSIVINVESNSIDIVITIDWIPVMVRSLWLGDEPLDIDSAPRRVAEELVRTISSYNDSNPQANLSTQHPIRLTGIFPIEEMAPVITEETEHPVLAIPPSLPVGEEFPAAVMAVNLGLAIDH